MAVLALRDVEETLKTASPKTRSETLRAVADMFMSTASDLDEDKVDAYDNILALLLSEADRERLADISSRMAPLQNAPRKFIRDLAHDDDIAIAGPVLTHSPRLSADDLCEIAGSLGNAHLLAISSREGLIEPLTDILISRGDERVARSVAHNGSARLSLAGLERLLERAATDKTIADRLRDRKDIAPDAFKTALAKVAAETTKTLEIAIAAQSLVTRMKQAGRLEEAQIVLFAREEKYAEVVASLAVLVNLKYETVENMMYPGRAGGIVLIGKSMGLAWYTISSVLNLAVTRNKIPMTEIKTVQHEFLELSRATAERIVRFWHVRQAVSA